jgi:hypothetical protein
MEVSTITAKSHVNESALVEKVQSTSTEGDQRSQVAKLEGLYSDASEDAQ